MPANRHKFRLAVKPAVFVFAFLCVAAVGAILDHGDRHILADILASPRVMAASTPDYNQDVAPILQKNCRPCHSSEKHKGHLVIDSYQSLMKGGEHGKTVAPGNAAQSRIVGMLEGKIHPQMPMHADPLTSAQIATIRAWIDAGAQGPAPAGAATP